MSPESWNQNVVQANSSHLELTVLDLFASPTNNKLPGLFSRYKIRWWGRRCTLLSLAKRLAVCLPSQILSFESSQQIRRGLLFFITLLAKCVLALRTNSNPRILPTVHNISKEAPPACSTYPHEDLKRALEIFGYTRPIINTLLSSRKPPQIRFVKQHERHSSDSAETSVRILWEQGSWLYTSSIMSFHKFFTQIAIKGTAFTVLSVHHPIQCFLKDTFLLSHPTLHCFPTWESTQDLRSTQQAPFDASSRSPLQILSCRLPFLLSITSARRVSEFRMPSIRKET